MDILLIPEKQREPNQSGGWQTHMARRRYQNGYIRRRGVRNPVWELLWREDFIKEDGSLGRRLAFKVLGPVRDLTLRQVRKLAEEFLRPLNQGKLTPSSTMPLVDFVEKQFVPNVFPVLKLSTQDRYRRTLNSHLLPAFGHRRLCDIRTLDLQRFVLQKMSAGWSWACADHYRNLMSKIFETAKKWGYFSGDNPAVGVELPEKTSVREKHILTPDLSVHLLNKLREPVSTMVLLAILTGLRVGEILGLRVQDVDFVTGEVRVEQSYYRGSTGSPKTKGSRRILPMTEGLAAVLAPLCAGRDSKELVFQTSKGTPFSDTNLLHRHLKPAGRRVGAPWLNWHTLRRTHATLLQVAGGSLKDAQAQLGHTKLSTTLEIYTVPIPAHQRAAVGRLSDLLTNVDKKPQLEERASASLQPIQ